jgi:hypothetical protein
MHKDKEEEDIVCLAICNQPRTIDLRFYKLTAEQLYQVVDIFSDHCTASGMISRGQLLPIIRDLGIEASVEEMQDMVVNLDERTNLTFEQFLCWWTGVEPTGNELRAADSDIEVGRSLEEPAALAVPLSVRGSSRCLAPAVMLAMANPDSPLSTPSSSSRKLHEARRSEPAIDPTIELF